MDDLQRVVNHYSTSDSHNDLLFVTLLLSGFFALHRLGELTVPDDKSLIDHRKITKRTSVTVTDDDYRYFLNSHKGDKFFEGNLVILQRHNIAIDPLSHFK